MTRNKSTFVFVLVFLPISLFGQFEINKHMVGPSFGISFLGRAFQIGINHEYGLSLNNLGIDEVGKIGIGGIFRYWNYSENFTYVKWDYTNILLGIQTNYHFYMPNDKVDPWIGIILAYNFASVNSDIKASGYAINEDSNRGLWLAVHAGTRYWLSNKIALNVKIGFGTLSYGLLDIGINYKFDSID